MYILSGQSTWILKKAFANIFVSFSLFVNILYEVCVVDYADLYAFDQQLSLACSGRLAPRAPQGKLYCDEQRVKLSLNLCPLEDQVMKNSIFYCVLFMKLFLDK